jgi:hypothetical protein
MTTLAEMRTLVRNYLDDVSSDSNELRWSDAEVDFSLESALETILVTLAHQTSHLDQQTEVVTSSGSSDLSALKVLYLKGVEHKLGNTYHPLSAADHRSPVAYDMDAELRITYVGKPAFPSNPAHEVTYGGTLGPLKSIDRQMGRLAALDLLPKDAEQNRPLSEQAAGGWPDIIRIGRGPGASEIVPAASVYGGENFYSSGYGRSYRYLYVPGTGVLRLVA